MRIKQPCATCTRTRVREGKPALLSQRPRKRIQGVCGKACGYSVNVICRSAFSSGALRGGRGSGGFGNLLGQSLGQSMRNSMDKRHATADDEAQLQHDEDMRDAAMTQALGGNPSSRNAPS